MFSKFVTHLENNGRCHFVAYEKTNASIISCSRVVSVVQSLSHA